MGFDSRDMSKALVDDGLLKAAGVIAVQGFRHSSVI